MLQNCKSFGFCGMKNARWVVETVSRPQMLRTLTLCYKLWFFRVLIKIVARSEMSFLEIFSAK